LSPLIVACGDAWSSRAVETRGTEFADDGRLHVGISQVSGYLGGVLATTPLAARSVDSVGAPASFHRLRRVANLAFASVTLKPSRRRRATRL